MTDPAHRAQMALTRLLQEIEEAKREVQEAQKTLEGLFPRETIIWKYKRCGKSACHCAHGTLHGPYAYLAKYENGKRKDRYLGKGWSPEEGSIPKRRYGALMGKLSEKRARLDRLLSILERVVVLMETR